MENPEPNDCPICTNEMNEMDDVNPIKQLSCKHKFHEECIDKHIVYRYRKHLELKCPLCNQEIDYNDYPQNMVVHELCKTFTTDHITLPQIDENPSMEYIAHLRRLVSFVEVNLALFRQNLIYATRYNGPTYKNFIIRKLHRPLNSGEESYISELLENATKQYEEEERSATLIKEQLSNAVLDFYYNNKNGINETIKRDIDIITLLVVLLIV